MLCVGGRRRLLCMCVATDTRGLLVGARYISQKRSHMQCGGVYKKVSPSIFCSCCVNVVMYSLIVQAQECGSVTCRLLCTNYTRLGIRLHECFEICVMYVKYPNYTP